MKNRLIPIVKSASGFGLWEPALVFDFYTYLTLKAVKTWEFRPDLFGMVLQAGSAPIIQSASGVYFVESPSAQVKKSWERLVGKVRLCKSTS